MDESISHESKQGNWNEVKIGSFGRRLLENTRSTQIWLKGKGQT